jgi:glycosyltransferase involved in cell wall biosynthesis
MNKKKVETILLHLPAYRDPELIPTIEDALAKAKNPKRVHFGICRQYHPEDKFDDLTKYKKDKRFKIYECLYTEAKGLPWARSIINEKLLGDEDYVCQLDSHHRFAQDWDETLIDMHKGLEKKGYKKPIIAGYSPLYDPFNDP